MALLLLTLIAAAGAAPDSPLNGVWEIVPSLSPNIDRSTQNLQLRIQADEAGAMLVFERPARGRRSSDTLAVEIGTVTRIPVTRRSNPTTVYSGIHLKHSSDRLITASWRDDGHTLWLDEKIKAEISQGETVLQESHAFTVSRNGEFLTYRIERASRPTQPTAEYVFKVKDSLKAKMIELEDDWLLKGDLQRQALLIGLQGLANRDSAEFYLVYPETWQFTYSKRLYEWYGEKRGYTFQEIKSVPEALAAFRDRIKGYVVWDKEVRTSLIVAYTVAGLEDAVVVSENQVPMLDSLGFAKIEDFRGRFTGMSDAEIYRWAKDRYWDRCSRKYLIWLGGHAGKEMKPGVADWGVANRVFFQDLSTDPADTLEYELAKELLADMRSDALIMGWHSYAKDRESHHVTLCSSFGLPVEGLHSVPNLSFEHRVGFSEGFTFKNNHNIEPGKSYKPEKKVYLACIQTDGIGIGAWLKPGRGEIPYAWETLMNYSWLAPSLLEFFYDTSTPNDYFIGCLSGPGYMYPKAVPEDKLPGLIRRADSLMKKLDLRVFDIMDYSVHGPQHEFADLTRSVVDAYYEYMPEAIGFVNGYAPANTFDSRDGRPMLSFEYYLSPTVSEAEAVADLIELATLNEKRPYFLLLHIRETSDVARVKSILGQLPESFELVPLDIFIKMAGENPTFTRRMIER
ncbi:hypothetical protein JW992_11215 [candidate division KSB1 bacterium]|nr:hypothetical protein [candidate division KSB1 bacterium]